MKRRATAVGTEHVVLSGGVFQNGLLLTLVGGAPGGAWATPSLVPERLPANDGGIVIGQAAVAAARMA